MRSSEQVWRQAIELQYVLIMHHLRHCLTVCHVTQANGFQTTISESAPFSLPVYCR